MTDYTEEQSGELEALQSIYENELEILSKEPPQQFVFSVCAQDNGTLDDPNPTHTASCKLQFTYTPTYPDEAPLMEIIESEDLDDAHLSTLEDLMTQQAEENIGMAMVFAIVSAVQEWLSDLTEQLLQDDLRKKKEKKDQDAEEEFKRFQGTIVTIETFLSWKAKFDAEMDEQNRLKGIKKQTTKKLTGKAMFLQDSTLDDSDVSFFQNEGENVEVDESLFQDLDDLDLEDGDLDDCIANDGLQSDDT